jgi:hypothetical protein
MFQPARRWRVLAAVGLVLALTQGRAWGQETVWARAATDVMQRIRESAFGLPPLPTEDEAEEFASCSRTYSVMFQFSEEAHPPPIFAWEKKDAAEWDFAAGTFLEAIREYKCAYFHYKALARRNPRKQGFAAAARVSAKYVKAVEDQYETTCGFVPTFLAGYLSTTSLDDLFPWLAAAEPQVPEVIDSAAPLFAESACPDAPISNPPFTLCFCELKSHSGFVDFVGSVTWESSMKPPPPLSLFTIPPTSDSTAPAPPERKDMLPDSERSQLLTELGVIATQTELLSSPPWPVRSLFGYSGYFH